MKRLIFTRSKLLHNVFTSCIMGVFSTLCFHIHLVDKNEAVDQQTIWGHSWENWLTSFTWTDPFVLILFSGFWLIFFTGASYFVDMKWEHICKPSTYQANWQENSSLFIRYSLIILIFWLPYILSWFPGGVYADTAHVIQQANTGEWTNRHTFFYTFCWWLCISLSSFLDTGNVGAICIMTVLQVIVLIMVLTFSLLWFKRHNVGKRIRIVTLFFYCLFPTLPLFALSLWKDYFFSIFLFLFSLLYIDICFAKRISQTCSFLYCILSFLVAFSRNNGVYVVLGSFLILALLKRKTIFYFNRSFFIMTTITICITLLIQGPFYSWIGASATFEENIGVPLQQIAAVIAYDGHLSMAQSAYLNSIMPLQEWAENYRPLLVDPLKWNTSFDISIITSNLPRFWANYFAIGLENPIIFTKAFLLNNCGFWDPFVGTTENIACYQLTMWPGTNYTQWDLIECFFGHSIRNVLEPYAYPSAAFFAWLMFISMTLLGNVRSRFRDSLLFSPVFILWFTLIIATPIAYSLRYFFTPVMMSPLFLILPFIFKSNISHQKIEPAT